jgi:hypothetical protein
MNITDDSVFIEPRMDDARKISQMISRQGDGRGFHGPDSELIIFDSYGNTHYTLTKFFQDSQRRPPDLGICLIFRIDGSIMYDADIVCRGRSIASCRPEDLFLAHQASVIRKIYHYMGVTNVRVVRD